ncbi:Uncharacterized protein FWK35_00004433 [Aphis craccivora]|uniref:Uncharacterized protein n=1 Tax=Aphis craccivora TaxID=307492 RepID=A0A6G0YKR4_APHCR|nr:Uncharacterized protein FWK35_00004433 [Aphis craccivora]
MEKNIEKEYLSFFVVQRVVQNKTYYDLPKQQSQTYKTGKICPVGMTTTNVDGHITVDFRRTHVGHILNMKFLHLLNEERDELAGKLNQFVNRFHAVDKRNLHNIKRDYDLDRDIVHTNKFTIMICENEYIITQMMLLVQKYRCKNKCYSKKSHQ